MRPLILLLIFFPIILTTSAQSLMRMDSVDFFENGVFLTNPYAGGFDQPQFSSVDLNQDGWDDLVVFDRAGDHVIPFVHNGIPGSIAYHFDPAWQAAFPPVREWMLMADYNCDGKADLFTALADSSGVSVYENVSTGNQLAFTLVTHKLMADGNPVTVFETDLPAIVDVDADGDPDILNFDNQGSHVRFYENTGNCNGLSFTVNTNCWGQFKEAGLSNDITLNTACKRGEGGAPGHAGSTICAIDMEGDSALEILLGDLNNSNLVFLHNGGSSLAAEMDSVSPSFPPANPANFQQFPAAFHLDVDHDGLKDLIVAPNAPNISINLKNVWWYKHTGTASSITFSFQGTGFLSETMIETGTVAHPAWLDYNGDGLTDLVIGTFLSRQNSQNESSGLTLYENTGTSQSPVFQLVSRNWLNLDQVFNPGIFGVHPAFGDMDGDGDMDMLLGAESGALHYFRNNAGVGNPVDFQLAEPFFQGIDVGNSATPQIIDINRDNLPDLVIGEQSGNLNYFENTGTISAPVFASGNNAFGAVDVLPQCCTGFSVPWIWENEQGKYELLVGSEAGEIFHYNDIENHLNDTFPLVTKYFGDISEGSRLAPTLADLNYDGKLDLIVGNQRGGIALYETPLSNPLENENNGFSSLFTLYPNPSGPKDEVSITLPYTGDFHLEIFNLNGQLILQQNIRTQSVYTLFDPTLRQGLYLVRITDKGGKSSTIKWMVR